MITKKHANELLNWEFRRDSTLSQPQTHYIGLCSGVNVDTGAITGEPASSVGYSRKAVTTGTTNWGAAANAAISNAAQQQFNTLTGTASNCTYWFISRSASGGVADYYGKLLDTANNVVSIPMVSGVQVWVAAGNISIAYQNPS